MLFCDLISVNGFTNQRVIDRDSKIMRNLSMFRIIQQSVAREMLGLSIQKELRNLEDCNFITKGNRNANDFYPSFNPSCKW